MKTFRTRFILARNILPSRSIMRGIHSIGSKRFACLVMASISIIFIVFFTFSPAVWSALSARVNIHSDGTIIAYAKSAIMEDIQTAIDAAVAAGGGTVYVPEGNFTFEPRSSGLKSSSGSPVGVRFVVPTGGLTIVGAGVDKTILAMPLNDTAPNCVMLQATGGHETSRTVGGWVPHGKLRISGITFKGRPNLNASNADTLIWLESCKDFRVDHCSFYYAGGAAIGVNDHYTQTGIYNGDPARVSQGVVDHCQFYDLYKSAIGSGGYGVQINRALHYLWTVWDDDSSSLAGVYDKNVFIEDCYFRNPRHAVACKDGGVYVLRYCTIEDEPLPEAATTGHPVRQNTLGCRFSEFYSNIIKYTGTYGVRYYGIHIEGGGALVYDNTITNLIHGIRIGNCEYINEWYPKGTTKDIYIWNNAFSGCSVNVYTFNNGMGQPNPTEGVDYFLHAPPLEWDYTPYPYPHPLTTEP